MKKRIIFQPEITCSLHEYTSYWTQYESVLSINYLQFTENQANGSNDPFGFRIHNSSHLFSVYIQRQLFFLKKSCLNYFILPLFSLVWKLRSWKTSWKACKTSFYSFAKGGKRGHLILQIQGQTVQKKGQYKESVSFSGKRTYMMIILLLRKMKYLQCFLTSVQVCCWLHFI